MWNLFNIFQKDLRISFIKCDDNKNKSESNITFVKWVSHSAFVKLIITLKMIITITWHVNGNTVKIQFALKTLEKLKQTSEKCKFLRILLDLAWFQLNNAVCENNVHPNFSKGFCFVFPLGGSVYPPRPSLIKISLSGKFQLYFVTYQRQQ